MADTPVLETDAFGRGGSSPSSPTKIKAAPLVRHPSDRICGRSTPSEGRALGAVEPPNLQPVGSTPTVPARKIGGFMQRSERRDQKKDRAVAKVTRKSNIKSLWVKIRAREARLSLSRS